MDEHFPRKEETRERIKYYLVKWYELNLLMRDWSSNPPKEGFILDCCSKYIYISDTLDPTVLSLGIKFGIIFTLHLS